MALPVTETFTASPSEALSAHTADTGQSWGSGTDEAASITVGDGTGTATISGQGIGTCQGSPASADYRASVTGRTGGTATNDRFGVAIRYDGGSWAVDNNGYLLWLQGDGNWSLFSVETGVIGSAIDSGSIGGFSESTDYKLEIICSGTEITVAIDDVEETPITNSDITATGNPGVYLRNANASVTSFSSTEAAGGIVPQIMHHRRLMEC